MFLFDDVTTCIFIVWLEDHACLGHLAKFLKA